VVSCLIGVLNLGLRLMNLCSCLDIYVREMCLFLCCFLSFLILWLVKYIVVVVSGSGFV